jgi:muconolactone delta-isomerase
VALSTALNDDRYRLLSIVIEWLGIVFDWWQLPQHYHAKNIFDAELNWALGDFLSNNLFYNYKKRFMRLLDI